MAEIEKTPHRKEAYYFSHDSNARNDEKILSMRMELGMEGYGIYWSIIEKMRENADYMCLNNFKVIAFDLRVEETNVKKVVEDFGLFKSSDCGEKFYSQSLMSRMEKMNEKSDKARQSANVRWNKKDKNTPKDANVMRTHTDSNAIKESKVKETKENEIKENIIDNNDFNESAKTESQWLETMAIQQKVSLDTVRVFIDSFRDHLIVMEEQKPNEKEFKKHFSNWINKQDLSNLRTKPAGRSNQLSYAN